MKQVCCSSWLGLPTAICIVLAGCGHGSPAPEAKDSKKDLPSFKEGKGLYLPDETRQSIGLEVADVTERELTRRLTTEVEVYDAGTAGNSRASGLVSKEQAELLHSGQPVSLSSKDGQTTEGKLAGVDEEAQPLSGPAEIIVEIPGAASKPAPGTFFTATMTSTNKEPATTIPSSALLRSAQGDFVYVVNGERLLRTPVKTGDEGDGFVQITDGLYAGDKVAVKPVQILWLTELRLASGGGDKD